MPPQTAILLHSAGSEHPLRVLGLKPRPYHALRRNGVLTVEHLSQMSEPELAALRGIGTTCLHEIRVALQRWQRPLAARPAAAGRTTLVEAWSLPAFLSSDLTDIRVLGLRPRLRVALTQRGHGTVSALVGLTVTELEQVRWVGPCALEDIREKLAAYAGLKRALTAPRDQVTRPLVPRPRLKRAAGLDLDHIPLRRLRLPRREATRLMLAGVDTVGRLVWLPAETLGPHSSAGDRAVRYLDWLAEQSSDVRLRQYGPAALPGGPSWPRAERSLRELVDAWLSRLSEDERHAVRLRYGLGEAEAGKGRAPQLSRARVHRAVRRSHAALLRRPLGAWLRAHLDALRRFLAEKGGLATAEEVRRELPACLNLGALDPVVACALLASVHHDISWQPDPGLLGDSHKPLEQVAGIRQAARDLGGGRNTPIPLDEMLFSLHASHEWGKTCVQAGEAFVLACLRTDPDARIEQGGIRWV